MMEEKVNRLKRLLGNDAFNAEETLVKASVNSSSVHYPRVHTDSEDEYMTAQRNSSSQRNTQMENINSNLTFPKYDLSVGEQINHVEEFCSLKALTTFPYDYIPAAFRDEVARKFFAKGRIYERTWDIFYIYAPKFMGNKSVLLIPHKQVLHFLVTINNELNSSYALPTDSDQTGLIVSFPLDGTPRPRYIGQSTSRDIADSLTQAVPSFSWRPDKELQAQAGAHAQGIDPEKQADEAALRAFRKKIELLLNTKEQRKRASKDKRAKQRAQKLSDWKHDLRSLKLYLGLINPMSNSLPASFAASVAENSISLDIPPSHPLDEATAPIFLAVDVESYERQHNVITEIGIATLDLLDIYHLPPCERATNWYPHIRARHLRIKEYAHLVNHEFVSGCPDRFHFGTSELINRRDAPHIVATCFKEPILNSWYRTQDPQQRFDEEWPMPSAVQWNRGISAESQWLAKNTRRLILVGHSLSADIRYLQQMGYNPSTHAVIDLAYALDTSTLDIAVGLANGRSSNRSGQEADYKQSDEAAQEKEEGKGKAKEKESRKPEQLQQPRSLGAVLHDLGIEAMNLHNAGNDAVYTLQALLALAVCEAPDLNSIASEQMQPVDGVGEREAENETKEEVLIDLHEPMGEAKSMENQKPKQSEGVLIDIEDQEDAGEAPPAVEYDADGDEIDAWGSKVDKKMRKLTLSGW